MAGAGSGKTRVLTTRINHLINKGISEVDIAAFTFTNKAAREMKFRLNKMLKRETTCNISTFHSYAYSILTIPEVYTSLGYTKVPQVIFESDKAKIIKNILNKYNIEYSNTQFVQAISKIKNKAINSKIHQQDLPLLNTVFHEYQKTLKDSNEIDFDDMIPLLIEVLEDESSIVQSLQLKYILVDECQDTNQVQFDLIYLLSKQYQNVFLVGDEDQLIYSFRNSDIKNLKQFEDTCDEVIILNQNYRSTQEILTISNQLININQHRIKKELITNNQENIKVCYNNYYSQSEEATEVIKQIKLLLEKTNLNYSDIAILYRNNRQSSIIEKELTKENINYTLYGGKQFFDYVEIKNIINTYRLLFNPYDEVAFNSIYNQPIPTLEAIDYINFIKDYKLQKEDLITYATKYTNEKFQTLGTKLTELKEKQQYLENDLFFDELLHLLRYNKYLKESNQQKDQYARIIDLKQMIIEIPKHELESSFNDLLLENKEHKQSNKISLLTIHKAKGLEFEAVFIIGLNEGIIPSYFAKFNDLEEERRLCYVAITRAKKYLFISTTTLMMVNGLYQKHKPSRFISEANIEGKLSSNFFDDYWYNK